jgi:thioredoxin 1
MKATATLIVLVSFTLGCGQSSINDEVVVDVNKFEQMINEHKDEIVLDVRTPKEFAAGHIPGAVLINVHADDFRDRIAELDKSKPILVYCAAGIRSEKASMILKESGFKKVYHLRDGLKAWSAAHKGLTK